MQIIALYKTWDGGEFVDASLASIYDHVEAIVMVHSDISWLGEYGNTVKPLALEWCNEHDKAGKVHHVDVSLTSQEAQYAAGLEYIHRHKLPYEAILAVDADEVWEDQYLERAKRQMRNNPAPAYRSNMHTYLKTPFYRVHPPFGSPTVLFADPRWLIKSPRGCQAPARQLDNVWMHHYTYVRATREAVERKLNQSCQADGGEMVVPNWMTQVYDRMPFGTDLHGFVRWREVWKEIHKIWVDQMPAAMRSAHLLKLWKPDGLLMDGEQSAIYRLAKGRRQAVDLGTYCGLSAVILGLACECVHTIDCYESVLDHKESEYVALYQTTGQSLQVTKALCDRFGNMTCENADTIQAAFTWTGGKIDVLLVDADHSEEATDANVEAWMQHMATGGLIIFHDNNEIHPGVQSAIRRLREDKRLRFIDPGEYSGSLAVAEVREYVIVRGGILVDAEWCPANEPTEACVIECTEQAGQLMFEQMRQANQS